MSITKQRLTTAKLLPVVIAAGMLFGASNAMAAATATFDFVDLIDTVGEGTWDDKSGTTPISAGGVWTVDSIGVNASADTVSSLVPGGSPSFNDVPLAYLDGRSGGPGGLGVCSLTSCDGNSDDNAGIAGDVGSSSNYETLILTFSDLVSLDSLSFNDRDHVLHTGDFSLKINGVIWTEGNSLGGIVPSSIYRFERIAGSAITRDFYLATATVTAVPIPAAAWLFGSALIGLAGVARKRKVS